MAGAITWIIDTIVVVILSGVAFSVVNSSLASYIANATGIQAVVLPLIAPFIALGVALIVIFGALRAAGVMVGGGGL